MFQTNNVAQRPYGLLTNVHVRRLQQLQEVWDGAGLDNGAGLVRGATGDVGQGPGGFELEGGTVLGENLNVWILKI